MGLFQGGHGNTVPPTLMSDAQNFIKTYTICSPSVVVTLQGARSAHLMALVEPAASS